ncbi:heme ABC transporter permease [Ahniella affigens]|uniref:Heme exporter protein C n=1 Tax=Ahniella affigens TaxID=2021234 RepID=A0A2P1PQF1_9GAMM|nr:heme ABC transporter permease CcmC [Ahniella affigens]AVP97076.1 heme ABC transporter permease [Ahniella affigens]
MHPLLLWFHRTGSPPEFYRLSGLFLPWMYALAALSGLPALYLGLFRTPADYLQGDSFRIIYIHVPSAWMSMFIFAFMAFAGAMALIWHVKIAEVIARAAAPIGAMFTAVTLITGSLWGRPTWGTYWVWDARLTSELVLLFLYFGVIALQQAIEDPRKAARAAAILALVGLVNLPVIHYSVEWWNTLHQGQSIRLFASDKSTIDSSMLAPLILMAFATKFWFAASLLARARVLVLEQESGKDWVRQMIRNEQGLAS